MVAKLDSKLCWYEEDCEWSLVACVFPWAFSEEQAEEGRRVCRNWFPGVWERLTGEKLTGKNSYVRRQEEFAAENAEHWVAFTCRRASDDPGLLVVSCRLGYCIHGNRGSGPETEFLVPLAEYQGRGSMPFVADPERHPELSAV
jgi:hypothetical protein